MPGPHNAFIDLAKRLRSQPINVVANASPIEVDVAIPGSNAHDLPQGSVLFGKVLQLVEVKIAAEPYGRQYHDLPVVHALAATLATAVPIDVLTDQFQDFPAQLRFTVNVLQRPQDWNDFVATLKVQFDSENGSRAQAGLRIKGKTHAVSSMKIGGNPAKNCRIPRCHDPLAIDLHWEFPKNGRQNGFFTISDRL
jgi:hypothetical protein